MNAKHKQKIDAIEAEWAERSADDEVQAHDLYYDAECDISNLIEWLREAEDNAKFFHDQFEAQAKGRERGF